MTNTKPIILWFRQDLRLKDNPALIAAHETGAPILPVYILDDKNSGDWKMGGASRWWLHESLSSLNRSLGSALCVQTGDAQIVLDHLIKETGAAAIYWNRCYEPWRIARDKTIKEKLKDAGVEVKSFNGSLLYEPHTVLKNDGTPYKVFTPFYKKGCLGKGVDPRKPEGTPENLSLFEHHGLTMEELNLLPGIPWHKSIAERWQPGEDGAAQRLTDFLDEDVENYKEGRNYPDKKNVSRLSPHLHFGEISPNQVCYAAKAKMVADGFENDVEHFLSELGWREFSYYLLYHFPDLPHKNMQQKFDAFPWREDDEALRRWQKGLTGYPIVDAGMRELWETGYMHNRVRMIVGSFLVKNLRLHWHHGEHWFWDTLVDADLANNSASWQWIAGCGADAAPYFRIFNPVTQGKKFDERGAYVRRFVPELENLPDKYIHSPWEAPDTVLAEANIKLGEVYPEPIVDLKASREAALEAFQSLKSKPMDV